MTHEQVVGIKERGYIPKLVLNYILEQYEKYVQDHTQYIAVSDELIHKIWN